MNNTIQSSYYAGLYGINANLSINSGKKSHTTVTGTNFYDMAVQTTARSTDSIRTENVDEIVNKVVTEASEGDIILLHDCYDSSVDAALRIIDILTKEGFEFVTVDEMILD